MGWLRFSKKVTSNARLEGKTAIVTGCNTGIGQPTVKDLYCRGCRVVMACRDVAKAEAAADEIRQASQGVPGVGVLVVTRLDLSSFASVRQCAQHLLQTETQINILINNAGVMVCPKSLTEDGFERQFATNHLGHFLFTLLLLPKILKSTPARIVVVSSEAHRMGGNINFDDINSEKSYSEARAYSQSKLANILFAKELAKRLEGSGVTTYALHPGAVNTELQRHADETYCCCCGFCFRNVFGCFTKSPEQGAQTTIYCAVDEQTANETGLYYADASIASASAKARDPALALRLWEESMKWVGLQDYDPFTAEDREEISSQPILVQPKSGWQD